MNRDTYLCISIDGIMPKYFHKDEINNLTAHELISKFSPEQNFLNVKTPLFSKPLNDNLELANYIYVDKQYISKYCFPPCYLFFSKQIFFEISIKPICQLNINIPEFYIQLNEEDIATKSIHQIHQLILKTFCLEVKSSYLSFLNNDLNIHQIINNRLNNILLIQNNFDKMILSENDSLHNLFQKVQNYQLYLYADLTDNSISLLNRRANILKEILSTERTYLNDLNIIQTIWKSGMENIIQSTDFLAIFDGISDIYLTHLSFLNNLEKNGCEYSTVISPFLIEFSEFFDKVYQYVLSYPSRFALLSPYEKNEHYQEVSSRLSTSCDGRDLKSYLIVPLKRITQYSPYLADLLSVTPKSHPDYSLLQFAYQKIDEFTTSIKRAIETSQKQEFLLNLQNQIINFNFMDGNRQLIMHINVHIGNDRKNGEILVFNDEVVVITKGKTSKLAFHSTINKFPYIDQFPDELSITVQSNQIHFMNEIELRSFFIELEKLQMREQLNYEKISRNPFFVWNSIRLHRKLPPISYPLVSFFDDSLIILSSNIGTGRIPQLYRIVLSTGNIYQTYAAFPSFDCPLVSATHNKNIYFIYKNEIFKYDIRPNRLSKFDLEYFEPRIGQSATFINDNLYIFGGKSLESNQLLNDLIIFNSRHETISIIPSSDTSPTPRWLHASFCFNNKLYIFGGETSDSQTQLYELDINLSQWKLIEIRGNISPMKSCKCALKNNFVVLLSENSDTILINLESYEVTKCENFRNVPNHLNNYDFVSTNYQNTPLIVITEQALYGLTMVNILRKSQSFSILPVFSDNLVDDKPSIELSQTPKRLSKRSVLFPTAQKPLSSSQKIDNEHLYQFGYGLKPNSPNKTSMKLRKSATSDKLQIPNNSESDYDLSLNSEEFKMFSSTQNRNLFTPQPTRNAKYLDVDNAFDRKSNSANTSPNLRHSNLPSLAEKLTLESNNENESLLFDIELDREINDQPIDIHEEQQNEETTLTEEIHQNEIIEIHQNDKEVFQTGEYIPLRLIREPTGDIIDLQTTENLIVEVKDDSSVVSYIATATISALITSGALYLLFRHYRK